MASKGFRGRGGCAPGGKRIRRLLCRAGFRVLTTGEENTTKVAYHYHTPAVLKFAASDGSGPARDRTRVEANPSSHYPSPSCDCGLHHRDHTGLSRQSRRRGLVGTIVSGVSFRQGKYMVHRDANACQNIFFLIVRRLFGFPVPNVFQHQPRADPAGVVLDALFS